MVVSLLVTVIALLWLLHRATRLLKIPAPTLIQVLGIDIPDTPNVSIDSVTASSVALHWEPPARANSVVKYILEVDGHKAGETDRSDTTVTLKDLHPDTPYTVNVLAVNPSSYRSHASTLRIHTRRNSEDFLPSNIQLGLNRSDDTLLVTKGRQRATSRNQSGAPSSAVSSGVSRNGNGNGNNGTYGGASNKRKKDKAIYTVESLTEEVESVQVEINDVLLQAARADSEFNTAESQLLTKLDELRERKKGDDHQRSAIRSETKMLEDSKRALEIQKFKLEKRLNQLNDNLDKQHDISIRRQIDIDKYNQSVQHSEQQLEEFTEASEQKVLEKEAEILQIQAQVSELEEDTRQFALALRKADAIKTTTLEWLDKAAKSVNDSGQVDQRIVEEILKSEQVHSKLKEELEKQIDIDKELERDWQRTQKDLETRYLQVHVRYEEAEEANKKAAQLYNTRGRPDTVVDSVAGAVADALAARRIQRSAALTDSTTGDSAELPTFGVGRNLAPLITSDVEDNETSLLSPSVDMLLPSNLFTADDITESFATMLKDPIFHFNGRASGSILSGAFYNADRSADANSSPPISLSSLHDASSISASVTVPGAPTSPQTSFTSFNGFPGFAGSRPSLLDSPEESTLPNISSEPVSTSSKKFSLFGKPREHPREHPRETGHKSSSIFFGKRAHDPSPYAIGTGHGSSSALAGDLIDSSVPTLNIEPIGSRRRSGSYSSVISGAYSMDANNPNHTSNVPVTPANPNINNMSSNKSSPYALEGTYPWGENSPPVQLTPSQPVGSSSFGRNGSRDTSISSTYGWPSTVFPENSNAVAVDSSPGPLDKVWNDIPSITIRDSDTPDSSESPSKSRFHKGFTGLFTGSNSHSNTMGNLQSFNNSPVEKKPSFASLFGFTPDELHDRNSLTKSTSDGGLSTESEASKEKDSPTKESILHKSMRTFTNLPKKTSNSKFNVRRLSLFGKKDATREELNEDELEDATKEQAGELADKFDEETSK